MEKKNIVIYCIKKCAKKFVTFVVYLLLVLELNHGQDKSAQLIILQERKRERERKRRERKRERHNICTILGYEEASYVE